MIRKIGATEHQIQSAIVEWANIAKMPEGKHKVGDFLLAIPNGGNRSISEAVRLKKEGVKKGVSDLFLAFPISALREILYVDFCGLWIEVKSKKGKLTKEQILWGERMKLIGYCFSVVKSVDEGIKAIKDYLGMK